MALCVFLSRLTTSTSAFDAFSHNAIDAYTSPELLYSQLGAYDPPAATTPPTNAPIPVQNPAGAVSPNTANMLANNQKAPVIP